MDVTPDERSDFLDVEADINRLLGRQPTHRETVRVLIAAWNQLKLAKAERGIVTATFETTTNAYRR
jgi:hypothetical protein